MISFKFDLWMIIWWNCTAVSSATRPSRSFVVNRDAISDAKLLFRVHTKISLTCTMESVVASSGSRSSTSQAPDRNIETGQVILVVGTFQQACCLFQTRRSISIDVTARQLFPWSITSRKPRIKRMHECCISK